MTLSLPPELEERVETELALGGFENPSQLIEEAVAEFLDSRRARRRLDALNRIAHAVEEAGLSDSVYLPQDGE
jgi:Arc/MetJ-type ribon-helix-helix transcriptional regulator